MVARSASPDEELQRPADRVSGDQSRYKLATTDVYKVMPAPRPSPVTPPTAPTRPSGRDRSVDPQDESDAQLIRRLNADKSALETFYRRHVGAVTTFAIRNSRTAAEVGDIVMETFLKAMLGAHTFDARIAKGDASHWLLRIAANVARDLRRADRRTVRLIQRVTYVRTLDEDDLHRIEDLMDAERLTPTLVGALSDLPVGERDAAQLVLLDEIPIKKAASMLGLSNTATRMRVSRARRKLREALATSRRSDGKLKEQVCS